MVVRTTVSSGFGQRVVNRRAREGPWFKQPASKRSDALGLILSINTHHAVAAAAERLR